MNHNMQPCSRMPLGAMSMGLGGPPNVPSSEAISHPRPSLATGGNAKKKRRTNAKAPRMQSLPCPITQDLNVPVENQPVYARPPQLSGYGDTVIASNPFDDMPLRASQMALMHSVPRHLHPQHQQQQQHVSGPRMMRGMGPMSSMGELSSMMGHNSMGPMNPTGNPMNLMGRISPMNLATSQQPSGAMGSMNNPMNRMSPMNNIGQSQQSPMNMMSNSMSCENPMSNMGQNQPMSTLNNRASPMSNMGSNQPTPMNMMNHPMGRMSPIKNAGPIQSQGAMNAINSHMGSQVSGPHMGSMGRGILSPINGISGGNQNHMENGPMTIGSMPNGLPNNPLNGPLSMNNPSGPFGPNAPHPYSHLMGMQMSSGNLGRSINDPVNTLSQMTHSNMNMPGPNGMNNQNMGGHPINSMTNDMNVAQRNQMAMQMGGPIGSMPGNMFSTMQNRHPINMTGGNMPPHGFQARPVMAPRTVAPSNGKVYPPDQHIIFNSQNRNAPPIYLCGSCHKEVNDNDQGIVCESGCNFWFHRNCVGLSEAAFHMLTQAPYAEWVCDNCTKGKNIPPIRFTT